MTELKVNIELLGELTQKPRYGALGDALWTDPHIAGQMLDCHLNPDIDAASRKAETIEKTCAWLKESLGLAPGHRLLDLGCGPGLYAQEFSKMGVRVTGVDFSAGSIKYARERARAQGQEIQYICGNYLEAEFGRDFHAAVIIYYDLGVLFPRDRDHFLRKVFNALKPGGWLALDVLAPGWAKPEQSTWNACAGSGFFRPHSHLVFTNSYHYPVEQAWLDQYVILDAQGYSVIRNWDHYYTAAGISRILEHVGFKVQDIREDLTGTELSQEPAALAVMAQKV